MLQDISATAIGDLVEAIELFNDVNGTAFDGLILATETIMFNSEQAKLTTNLNPTESKDTRYSSDDLDIPNQTSDLLDRHEKGEITREQLIDELDNLYGKANEKYGIIKEGEKSQIPTPVCKHKKPIPIKRYRFF